MQITTILLATTAILTFLSGLAVFLGITKRERIQGAWYFIMTLGTAAWSVAIGTFLALPEDATNIAPIAISVLYIGAIVMLAAFVGYVGWKFQNGRAFTAIYCLIGIALSIALLRDPSILYSEIILSRTGNSIAIVDGWFYWGYTAYCIAAAATMLGFTLYRVLHTKRQNERAGMSILLIGTSIAGVVLSIFDLFLPPERYDLIWIGPLATGLNILCFYYATIRFRIMTLTTGWLKILSYIIIMMTGAVIYMTIFFVIFTAIFRIPSPSIGVLILNFTMVLVVLLLIPVITEIGSFIRSMIEIQSIDVTYIIKKINRLNPQTINLTELSAFLADHLHLEYVGFLVNGRLYSSIPLPLSVNELALINNLSDKHSPSIWHNNTDKSVSKIYQKQDIYSTAELKDSKGETFGQIILGKPLDGVQFDRRDLIQIEMIINLVAILISSKNTSRSPAKQLAALRRH